MRTKFVTRDFELTESIREFVAVRLEDFDDFGVRSVTVTLGDANGPRGGVDKYCRIFIALPGHAPFRIEKHADDLYVAMSEAIRATERKIAETRRKSRTTRKPRMLEAELQIG